MIRRKTSASRIREFLKAQQAESWLRRGERSWWPRFVFHYTHIVNAVSIFDLGWLRSRTRAEELGVLKVSSGSPNELAQTEAWIKDCARFYFRPRTPTQFYHEGIKSKNTLSRSKYPSAHCPVPIFFLFDAAEILTRADCSFSDGGLNNPPYGVFSTADELAALPWKRIYHTGWYDRTIDSDIAHRRNAEIVVPKEVDLSALRFIFCRSAAERETLVHLLSPELRNCYQDRIVATSRSNLFFRKHTFVRAARLSSESATFSFSPETLSPGPFHLRWNLTDEHGVTRSAEEKEFYANQRLQLNFRRPFVNYTVRLALDGYLAYGNRYEQIDIPF